MTAQRAGQGQLRRTLVETQILDVAARMFAERGVAATSLEAIAAEVDLHRVSLYHYFESKEALVQRLVTDMVESAERAVEAIAARRSEPPPGRLLAGVHDLLGPIVEAPSRFRLFLTSGVELPPELGRRQREVRHRVTSEIEDIVREGQRTGEFRPGDPALMVFGIVGMCNWVAWWPRPVRDARPYLADQLGELALASVSAGAVPAAASPEGVIATLHGELDRLTALLGER